MALADEIAVKLGLKTTDFKAALAAANADVQRFKDSGGDSGSKIEGLFERLDHHLLGTRAMAHALATALGLNLEHIAESFARFVIGMSKDEEDAIKRVADLSEQTAALYDKAFAKRRTDSQNLAHDEQEVNRNLAERTSILAAQETRKKKIAAEDADSAHILIKLDEEQTIKDKVRLAELDKRNAELTNSIIDGKEKIKSEDDKYQKELMDDVLAAQEMDKKASADRLRLGEKDFADQKRNEQELHDLKLAALAPEKQLVQLKTEQTDLELQIKQQKDFGVSTTETEVELQKNLNKQTAITDEIAKKTKKTEEEITKEKIKQLEAIKNSQISVVGVRGGNQFNDASDAALAEVARRNRNQAQAIQNGQGGYGIAQQLEIARLIAEAMNAEKELAFRRDLQNTIQFQGVDAARRNFAGDPLQFDKVLQQFTGQQEANTIQLQDINSRLATAGFPKRGPTG